MDGIELACRYSFRPNILGLCGPENNFKLFDYALGKTNNKTELKKLLRNFVGAFTYYQLIAKANKITDPFDFRVVEAYWIGNNLLKKITDKDIKKTILTKLTGPGLLENNIAQNLAAKMPSGFAPHHSFHVFYMGSVTGVVPKNLKSFNSCHVSWGRIKGIKDESLIVLKSNLVKQNNKIKFSQPVAQKILYKVTCPERSRGDDQSFIKNPRVGDYVSIHWNWACQKLTKDFLARLKYWTNYNLKIINKER